MRRLLAGGVAALVLGGAIAAETEARAETPSTSGLHRAAGAAPTKLLCATRDGTRYKRKARPRQCTIFGPGGSFGGGVNLRKLRWHGWGHSRARARGIEIGFHRPPQHIRVRVQAWRPRMRCGHRVYTRFKARSRFGTSRPRPHGCPGPTFPAAKAPPAHGWDHVCGSQVRPGAGWYRVRAYNVVCPTARRVARRFWNSGGRDPGRWNCQDKRLGTEVWQADCTRRRNRQHQHVRFIYGA